MTETALSNLRLVGTTSSAGGRFGNVRITGEAVLTGDIECRNLTCMGTTDIKGNLRADSFKLTGECKVEGNLNAARIGAIGNIETAGGLSGDRIKLTGEIRVRGDCEAERLQLNGALTVEGLLNADQIELRIHGPSRAREIGGGSIAVRRSRSVLFRKFFLTRGNGELIADLIEGDTLVLEHTRAAVVRGNKVTLGTGCEVGRVEYRNELVVGKKAKVREKVKL